MGIKIDFGNGMVIDESILENMAVVSLETVAKILPKEYLCTAVLKEILTRAKCKTETMLISSFQKCLEEQKK